LRVWCPLLLGSLSLLLPSFLLPLFLPPSGACPPLSSLSLYVADSSPLLRREETLLPMPGQIGTLLTERFHARDHTRHPGLWSFPGRTGRHGGDWEVGEWWVLEGGGIVVVVGWLWGWGVRVALLGWGVMHVVRVWCCACGACARVSSRARGALNRCLDTRGPQGLTPRSYPLGRTFTIPEVSPQPPPSPGGQFSCETLPSTGQTEEGLVPLS
jgi:hypothetical protein